jgi:hypothetical protein
MAEASDPPANDRSPAAVVSSGDVISDDDFRAALAECRLRTIHLRTGLAAYDVRCVASRVAAHSGMGHERTIINLRRWAESLGGNLDENILWLPSPAPSASPTQSTSPPPDPDRR